MENVSAVRKALAGHVDKSVPSMHFWPGWKREPDAVVVHYTGGPSGTAARWFANPAAKASAHFVITRSGQVVQCVDVGDRAWHAGKSSLYGDDDLNQFSWGIELENWGPLVRRGPSYFAWPPIRNGVRQYRRRYAGGSGVFHAPTHPRFEYWERFSDEQLDSLCIVLRILTQPDARVVVPRDRVVGHEFVSPGRKLDPGPAFPWRDVLDRVYGPAQPPDEMGAQREEDDASDEAFFASMSCVPTDRAGRDE